MPKIDPKVKVNFGFRKSENEVVKLKDKGETITLRIADYPGYYGQHWIDDEKKYVPCARVNSSDPTNPDDCDYCNRYQSGEDELRPMIKFIFPAINRKTGKAIFFETSQMVWKEMESQESKGIKIFDYDWLIERTENKPKYYEVTRLEKDELNTEQSKAYKEAKELDVESLITFKLGYKKPAQKENIIQDELLDEKALSEIDEQSE